MYNKLKIDMIKNVDSTIIMKWMKIVNSLIDKDCTSTIYIQMKLYASLLCK